MTEDLRNCPHCQEEFRQDRDLQFVVSRIQMVDGQRKAEKYLQDYLGKFHQNWHHHEVVIDARSEIKEMVAA